MAERQRVQAMKDKERELKQSKLDEEERKKTITKERKQKKEERERLDRMAQKVCMKCATRGLLISVPLTITTFTLHRCHARSSRDRSARWVSATKRSLIEHDRRDAHPVPVYIPLFASYE